MERMHPSLPASSLIALNFPPSSRTMRIERSRQTLHTAKALTVIPLTPNTRPVR